MHIVVNVGGKIKVDDVGNVRYVQPSRCYIRRNQYRRTTGRKAAKCVLPLLLRAIAVYAGGRQALPGQYARQLVGPPFSLDEDQHQTAFPRPAPRSEERPQDLDQHPLLVRLLRYHHPLLYRVRGRPHTANGDEDVVTTQEVTSELLYLLGEGRTEHKRLPLRRPTRHTLLFDNAAYLGFEAHVQHAIRLVQDQYAHVRHRHLAPLYQVNQPPRACDEEVAPVFKSSHLGFDADSTIHHRNPQGRAVCELARLLVYLLGQFTRGGQDEGQGMGHVPIGTSAVLM
mmetsp:Transcript_36749/g.59378  ORF Transcript_36749/g.59378 Transcript_36749/m.59378 type:complete len:284 (-) Transcript_36749:669-1520(-)